MVFPLRATGSPQGTGEPWLSPVAGALHFLSHPSPRCCRALVAYFLCDAPVTQVPRAEPRSPAATGDAGLLLGGMWLTRHSIEAQSGLSMGYPDLHLSPAIVRGFFLWSADFFEFLYRSLR